MTDSKRLKKIKSELKSEIWEIEYSELKKRLSSHDIYAAADRQRLGTVQSLQQLGSTASYDPAELDENQDLREMANWILQEYFGQQPAMYSSNNNTPNVLTAPNGVLSPLRLPQTIKQRINDAHVVATDPENDEETIKEQESESFSETEQHDDDEKKMTIPPIDSSNPNGKTDEIFDQNLNGNSNGNELINGINEMEIENERNTMSQKVESTQSAPVSGRHFDEQSFDRKGIGNLKVDVHRRQFKNRKYSPRADVLREPDNGINGGNGSNNRLSRERRIEIRAKFRRGVRKAMLVNAWSAITRETDANHYSDSRDPHKNKVGSMRLSLSAMDDHLDNVVLKPFKSNQSPSYSTPFCSFMSDNLMAALSTVGTWEFDPFEFFGILFRSFSIKICSLCTLLYSICFPLNLSDIPMVTVVN